MTRALRVALKIAPVNETACCVICLWLRVLQFNKTKVHSTCTSSVQLLSSAASGVLSDTVGRLPVLVLSTVLMAGALAGFGFYSFYQVCLSLRAT